VIGGLCWPLAGAGAADAVAGAVDDVEVPWRPRINDFHSDDSVLVSDGGAGDAMGVGRPACTSSCAGVCAMDAPVVLVLFRSAEDAPQPTECDDTGGV